MSENYNTSLVENDLSTRTKNKGRTKSCWETCCTWAGLGCCYGKKLEEEPVPEVTQSKDRQCTDVPCCLFLLAVLLSQIVLILYASSKGADPEYLVHGVDYCGNLCQPGNSRGRYTAWPALKTTDDIRICTTNCAYTNDSSMNKQTKMVDNYPSVAFMGAWCIPEKTYFDNETEMKYSFNSMSESLNRAVGDLNTAKWLILGSAFIAIVMSFLYIRFIDCMGRFLITLSVITLFVGGFMVCAWLLYDGICNITQHETRATGEAEIAIGIIVFVLWFSFFMALFWTRKKMELVFGMMDEASRAVRDIPSTLVFPVLYSLVGIAYLALWVAIALYIYSCKEKYTKDTPQNLVQYFGATYIETSFNEDLKNALAYHLVCLVYLLQVIVYFGFMVLAGVFADWYFSAWDTFQCRKIRGYGTTEMSKSPVLGSLFRVLRFHLGSLAFGALVITPVRFIRWSLTSAQRRTQNAQNALTKCLLGCANCWLNCFECIMDKVNEEGFILTSLYGTNYCYSSLVAVKLIYTNVLRTVFLEGISHYVEFFGRIAIAAITTGICLTVLCLNNYYHGNLSSVLVPGIAVFVVSFLIATLFLLVYEVAVDTIFLCYLIDEQTHTDGAKFAHENLTKLVNTHKNSV